MIGVGITDSVKVCQELIQEALNSVKGISMDPPPLVFVEDLGPSTVNIRVYYWFDSKTCTEAVLKSYAIVRSKEILLANGMHLPDSNRELILTEALKVQLLESSSEEERSVEEKKKILQSQAHLNFHEARGLESADGEHDKKLRQIADEVKLPTQSGSDNLLATH